MLYWKHVFNHWEKKTMENTFYPRWVFKMMFYKKKIARGATLQEQEKFIYRDTFRFYILIFKYETYV